MSSCDSRSIDALDVRAAPGGLLHAVVEEIVAFLERLRLRLALQTAAAIDVEVREDAEKPRAHVRSGRVRLPAAEGAGIRLLDEILGLLARGDEATRDAVDLICKLERLLLEADAVTGICRQLAWFGFALLCHPGHPIPAAY